MRYPTISVVVLSAYHDRDRVMKALDLGALGFIPKSAQREVMLGALNLIRGRHRHSARNSRSPRAGSTAWSWHPRRRTSELMGSDLGLHPDGDTEVLALMMQGKSNKAICRALALAEPTVQIDVSAILKGLKECLH